MREPNARERRRLQQIAFHQAGHAVAAHALGVAFDGVSIFPDEFERGEHLSLSSPDIGADVHIRILLAGGESCVRFDAARLWSERDEQRDNAQIRDLAKGLALSDDELRARIYAFLPRVKKLFARPASQAAVRALATALLANGRLDGQHARDIIREARRAARKGGANGPLALSDTAPAILPDLISAVPPPTVRGRSYEDAEIELLVRQAGSWDERDLVAALDCFNKVNRLEIIKSWHLQGRLTPDELRACLAHTWSLIEFPHESGINALVKLFKAAGFVTDVPDLVRPARQLTVYRGAVAERRRGMSWTMNVARATWFAQRWAMLNGPGQVYVAEVPPQHVLGIFNGREEEEVVVNPRGLRNVREYLES